MLDAADGFVFVGIKGGAGRRGDADKVVGGEGGPEFFLHEIEAGGDVGGAGLGVVGRLNGLLQSVEAGQQSLQQRKEIALSGLGKLALEPTDVGFVFVDLDDQRFGVLALVLVESLLPAVTGPSQHDQGEACDNTKKDPGQHNTLLWQPKR